MFNAPPGAPVINPASSHGIPFRISNFLYGVSPHRQPESTLGTMNFNPGDSVGFVGWRGMVGSVLMKRMVEEGDFEGITPIFFTTSNVGGAAPTFDGVIEPSELKDAYDIDELRKHSIV